MEALTDVELANWGALYLAAGMCCAIAFIFAIVVTIFEVHRDRSWAAIGSVRAAILFVPGIWWRWQKLYLTSMPATLGIVGLFAASMDWS